MTLDLSTSYILFLSPSLVVMLRAELIQSFVSYLSYQLMSSKLGIGRLASFPKL